MISLVWILNLCESACNLGHVAVSLFSSLMSTRLSFPSFTDVTTIGPQPSILPKGCHNLGNFRDCRTAHLTWWFHAPSLDRLLSLLHLWPASCLMGSPQLCWPWSPAPFLYGDSIILWLPYCLSLVHAFSVSTVNTSSHSPWRSQFIKNIASTIKEGSRFTRVQCDLSFFSPSLCMSTGNLAHLSLSPTSAWGPTLSWLFRNLVLFIIPLSLLSSTGSFPVSRLLEEAPFSDYISHLHFLSALAHSPFSFFNIIITCLNKSQK